MAEKTFDLTKRETFDKFTTVTLRFSDTDMLGHINNVAVGAYFEAARCELFYELMHNGGLTERGKTARIDFVLARVSIDFKKEFFYPGTIEVGSRFTRLGNRSIATGYGLFVGDTCHATSESINVFFDLEERTSVAPPPKVRELLEAAIAK
ncbi:MAG: acyl-CoA thioesterase [Hyphomicrobiaceae bacterium]